MICWICIQTIEMEDRYDYLPPCQSPYVLHSGPAYQENQCIEDNSDVCLITIVNTVITHQLLLLGLPYTHK